ncbi:hypothetical protein [Acidocella sp.]|jgi:hypothetical protein|uniref:hypothetical protein n=1 Tax=Acidocella sp. TaxID=50710 RepID=UPI002F42D1B1
MWPYSYLMSGSGVAGGHYVELPETKFFDLLQRILVFVEVDEAWYRATYHDVDEAVRAGRLASAREHYVTAGYFENRFPHAIQVNESWYLAEYPDVAEAIRTGLVSSATQHFENDGFKERRLPWRGWSLVKTDDTQASRLNDETRTGKRRGRVRFVVKKKPKNFALLDRANGRAIDT